MIRQNSGKTLYCVDTYMSFTFSSVGDKLFNYAIFHSEKIIISFSLDVKDEDFTRGRYRADAIYMRGTEELSTQDVFDYFQAYAPANIEWINDYSCK